MVDTCTVTWTARDFNFGTLASARLVFIPRDPLKLLGWSNALYVPNRIEVLSDGSGAGSVALVPGYYILHVTSYAGTATAGIAVPDEAAATIGECIDQTLSFPALSELQAILADAEAAAASANAALDSFDDRYLGSKSANPVLDNDGAALLTGALYFNTVASEMRVYTGVAWVAAYVNDSTYVPLAGGTMTGALAVPAGSAGSPSISISGDTDTGVWSPGANALAISTGATERMRIDASGNVGIGTSSPAAALHLQGVSAVAQRTLRLAFDGTYYSEIYQNGAGGLEYKTMGGLPHIWYQNAAERMRIDASGNVGIGTSSPAARLHLGGSANNEVRVDTTASGYLQLGQFTNGGFISTSSSDATAGVLRFGTGSTERLRIDASGNVGIGTSSPSTALTINRSGATDADLFLSNGTSGTALTQGANGNFYMLNYGAYNLIFGTNSAEKMRVDASGNLLVGTTGGLLNERIRAEFVAGNTGITTSVASTAAQSHIAFFNGSVVGSIGTFGSATSYNTSSDYRLKEDLQPIADASSRLASLNPVNFAWKADGTRTDGFLAHEVQAVVPQAVTGEKDGEAIQAIDHSKLVPLLTAALQEALAKIASLETRITALEA